MQTVNLKLIINEQKINETINYDQQTLLSDNLFGRSRPIAIDRVDYSNYIRVLLLLIENIKTVTISNIDGLKCLVSDPSEPMLSFELKPYYNNKDMIKLAKLYRTNQYDKIDLDILLNSQIISEKQILVCLPKLQYIYLFNIEDTYIVVENLIELGFKLDKAVLNDLLKNKPNTRMIQGHRELFYNEFDYAYIFINHRNILNPEVVSDLVLLFYIKLFRGHHYESYKISELIYTMMRKGYFQFDPELYDQEDIHPVLAEQYNNYISLLADVLIERKLTPQFIDEIFTDVSEYIPSIFNVNKNGFIKLVQLGEDLRVFEINYPTQFYIHQIVKYYRSSLEAFFNVKGQEDELHGWLWDDTVIKFIGSYSKALTEMDYGEIKKDVLINEHS